MDGWSFRFQTVVDELVSNAIEHGCMEGDEVRLSLISLKNKYLFCCTPIPLFCNNFMQPKAEISL